MKVIKKHFYKLEISFNIKIRLYYKCIDINYRPLHNLLK